MRFCPFNKAYDRLDEDSDSYSSWVRRLWEIYNMMEEVGGPEGGIMHRTRPWEWTTALLQAFPCRGERVIDVGGLRSPFGFLLAEICDNVTVMDTVRPTKELSALYASHGIEFVEWDSREPWPSLGDFSAIYSTNALEDFDWDTDFRGDSFIKACAEMLRRWLSYAPGLSLTVDYRLSPTGRFDRLNVARITELVSSRPTWIVENAAMNGDEEPAAAAFLVLRED